MQDLNIIPPQLKKEIKINKIKDQLEKLFLLILFSVSFYGVVLIIAKTILISHYSETIAQASSITKSTENYTKKVAEINNTLNQIIKIQNENIKWSGLLLFFKKNNAQNKITYNLIEIDKKTNQVKINGHAEERKNILFLKEKIENNPVFSDIDFPIKNILQKRDIDFEISLKIKNYDFEQL